MALIRVSLSQAITASQLTFGVSSTASQAFPAVGATPVGYQPMLIDDEMTFLVSCPAVNMVTVRMRGSDGTEAVAHDIGASVVTSASPIDFPMIAPGAFTQYPVWDTDRVTYGQDGAITVPIEPTTVFLAKTSVGAFTLGAPSLASNGMTLSFVCQTAFAHVVTTPGVSGTTGLFYTGSTGNPFTIMTMAAAIGATVTFRALNGAWVMGSGTSSNSATFS